MKSCGENFMTTRRKVLYSFLTSGGSDSKNPINLLMEAGVQVGLKVTFTDLQMPGFANSKTFACDASLEGLVSGCRGYGTDKKEAKVNAAKKAINMLTDQGGSDGNSSSSGQDGSSQINTAKSQEKTFSWSLSSPSALDRSQDVTNPIGQLQEFAASRLWALPQYDTRGESGESHCKTFTVECRLEGWSSQGTSSTKKKAKYIAAENMLEIAFGQPGGRHSQKYSRSTSASASIGATGGAAKVTHGSFSPERTYPSASFLHDFDKMDLRGDRLKISPRHTSKNSSGEQLKRKATSKGCEIEWKDFEAKGISGNYLCFVRVNSKQKTAVCGGSGPTILAAHEDAAYNALECWN